MCAEALFKNPPMKVPGSIPADTWTTKAKRAGLVGNTNFLCHRNKHVTINTFFGWVQGTMLWKSGGEGGSSVFSKAGLVIDSCPRWKDCVFHWERLSFFCVEESQLLGTSQGSGEWSLRFETRMNKQSQNNKTEEERHVGQCSDV